MRHGTEVARIGEAEEQERTSALPINLMGLKSGLQNVNPVDVGVIGGLQFHFDPILVSGRYEMGLTDVTSDRNMQNGNFTFLVGVAFI